MAGHENDQSRPSVKSNSKEPVMNEIVQMVAQKFNLSPDTAQQIVTFLLQQLKGRLPEGMGAQLEGFLAGGGTVPTEGGGIMDTVKNMASSLLGKE